MRTIVISLFVFMAPFDTALASEPPSLFLSNEGAVSEERMSCSAISESIEKNIELLQTSLRILNSLENLLQETSESETELRGETQKMVDEVSGTIHRTLDSVRDLFYEIRVSNCENDFKKVRHDIATYLGTLKACGIERSQEDDRVVSRSAQSSLCFTVWSYLADVIGLV